jgi:type II secretory pathway pseudopilin PulG
MDTKNQGGFTVLELLLVCEIIAIMAALTIPSVLRARIDANESAAIANLSQIIRAEVTYNSAKGMYGTLDQLAAETGEGTEFLEKTWGENVIKSGYRYKSSNLSDVFFTVTAVPVEPGKSAIYTYIASETGEIAHEVP